jgi:hypothetical protein
VRSARTPYAFGSPLLHLICETLVLRLASCSMQAEGRAPRRYIELDFHEVTARKAAIIGKTPELRRLFEGDCAVDEGAYIASNEPCEPLPQAIMQYTSKARCTAHSCSQHGPASVV